MSILSGALTVVGGAIVDLLLRGPGRSIAGIIPGVVIEEDHTDELAITTHPVEKGANITDHAVKQPATVSARYGWSQSGGGIPLASLGAPSPREVYDQLRALQATREPFDLVTGKRSYKNMLIKRLGVTTDAESENCLMVEMEFQEVLIIDTAPQSGSASVGDPENLKFPEQNSGTVNAGQQIGHDVTGQNSDAALEAAGVVFGP